LYINNKMMECTTLQEEDGSMWPFDQEWGNQQRLPNRRSSATTSSSRRIDMAAMINQAESQESIEFPKEKFIEQYSDTLDESRDSQDDEDSNSGAICMLSRPCLCTAAFVLFAVIAVFTAGMGTALATTRSKNDSSFSAANSAGGASDAGSDNASGNGPLDTLSPPSAAPVTAQPTTAIPTAPPSPQIVFDVGADFDSDSMLDPEEEDPDSNSGNPDEGQNDNPANNEGGNGQDNGGQLGNPPENGFDPIFVGVYYYPWHKNNFHNGEGYLRKELLPQSHVPELGEYDDSKPEVISRHFSWSRQANVGLWVTSWWGPGTVEDRNTLQILDHDEIGDLKIALHYETSGRLGLGHSPAALSNVESDIAHMCENYFGHSNYYRVDGRPVIFVYLTRYLERVDMLAAVVFAMRNAANLCGEDIFIVGDHVFESVPDPTAVFEASYYLDAITNYDFFGAIGRPPSYYAGKETIDEYYRQQEVWKSVAQAHDCRYFPTVSPGYNDRGVRLENDHPPLSRRLTPGAAEGSSFGYQIEQARELVDLGSLMMVNSFNEWHEGTIFFCARMDYP
jgi:glycoprotein endo-alpha-1,2-mannosidase